MWNHLDNAMTRREICGCRRRESRAPRCRAGSALLAEHAAQAAAPPTRAAKSCILLWMDGGPSHVDTFDPKPDAAAEVRGDLKPIAPAFRAFRSARNSRASPG